MLAAYEHEIAQLTERYGAPLRVSAALAEIDVDPLRMDDRIGEVCMVIRRPDGLLLTAKKDFYPAGAHRLLTGGIHAGEPILSALLREVAEETSLSVTVSRFLALISYPPSAFVTCAFLLDAPAQAPVSADPDEQIESFGTIAMAELPARAALLAGLPDVLDEHVNGTWGAWGRFRAVVHRVVYQTLSGEDESEKAKAKS